MEGGTTARCRSCALRLRGSVEYRRYREELLSGTNQYFGIILSPLAGAALELLLVRGPKRYISDRDCMYLLK